MWVYRAERQPHDATQGALYLDIEFDPDYKLSSG